MERKLLLELVQKVSILPSGVCGMKEDVPIELQVKSDNINYYPVGYLITYNNGKPVHTAVLHDLKANCIVNAKLETVEKA